MEYVKNDAFEIELHNLNEVNEYFRIFKDEIVKKESKYQREINDFKMQINLLKSKVESGSTMYDKRMSCDNARVSKPIQNENITVLSC